MGQDKWQQLKCIMLYRSNNQVPLNFWNRTQGLLGRYSTIPNHLKDVHHRFFTEKCSKLIISFTRSYLQNKWLMINSYVSISNYKEVSDLRCCSYQFSIEFSKIKSKVLTLANKKRTQINKWSNQSSEQTHVAGIKCRKLCVSHNQFRLYFLVG